MSTPNLAITHIQSNQDEKEKTANEAFDRLDSSLCGLLTLTVTGDKTLSSGPSSESENMFFRLNGTPAANFTVTVPTKKKLYIVENNTGKVATVKTAAGTGPTVANAVKAVLYCDGTNVVQVI